MPIWTEEEIGELDLVIQMIENELKPLPGKNVLVLCCGAGEVVLRLAKKMGGKGSITGLDLSDDLLAGAREKARAEGLEGIVRFQKAEKDRLPLPDESFDALVSEFIAYPAPLVTEIGQLEMAWVLRPGGKMLLTDVILAKPLPQEKRKMLKSIGLDYLCEATQEDFLRWMEAAGLHNLEVIDLTPTVKKIWQERNRDSSPEDQPAYSLLLNDPVFSLGKAIAYIYLRGER